MDNLFNLAFEKEEVRKMNQFKLPEEKKKKEKKEQEEKEKK